ncbi:EAL and modified HD-GYP domain-containing signal transduction protein [Variovorax sp. HW608]|uniref:EAL and HDOD domain-containing protein n=1 Tax=Variovorax sp. HW608 TaxID=1034889 RepID=UPI00081F7A1A|nr:HDOD domain-containing protein [Variovorax sp. HW608]SCK60148.1 EAL and modified HD-GYP domain-containing signal transduction protein [Variovorax sp. HW608]
MRFDFFRRPGSKGEVAVDELVRAVAPGASEASPEAALLEEAQAKGYVSYALQLDAQMRVQGLRFAWRDASGGADASARCRALVECIAKHLNPPKGWRLGRLAVYLDVTVDALFLNELQGLPPENVVLCMGMDDLADPDTRSMLLFLREQGFGFMLRDPKTLPQDPELLEIVTHLDVGAGDPALITEARKGEPTGRAPIQLVATRMNGWDDFEACAEQCVDVLVEGRQAPPVKEVGELQPESILIVRLMQMLKRNENVRSIEAALKRDVALTYRLLRHINSPAIGVGVEVTSLRHAVAMLGYQPLFRWLSLLLATSNRASSHFMMKRAIMRGRFVELMGQGMLPASESDNLFVVGMFSLIDRLLGVPMKEVLEKVQLTESVQQAILSREGVYAPFLSLVEACETDNGDAPRLAEALFVSAGQVNAAHLSAMVWSQEASAIETA